MWQAYHLLAFCRFAFWTFEERVLFDLSTENDEGEGEKSVKHRLGEPLNVNRGSYDLPKTREDVKFLQNKKRGIDQFGFHAVGRNAWGDIMLPLLEDGSKGILEHAQKLAIARGQVGKTMLATFPTPHRDWITYQTTAEFFIGAVYDGIYTVTRLGYIHVPRRDFNQAFEFTGISKGSPKYKLTRMYVDDQINLLLPDAQTVEEALRWSSSWVPSP